MMKPMFVEVVDIRGVTHTHFGAKVQYLASEGTLVVRTNSYTVNYVLHNVLCYRTTLEDAVKKGETKNEHE